MSIWCSWDRIGTEDGDWREVMPDGKLGPKVARRAERGDVRAYADGWSNHYPTDGFDDPTANVGIAHIPVWCVPGRRGEEGERVGPWVRLDIDSAKALTWWTRDGEKPTPAPVRASVVLNEDAARALIADLSEWLERPKAHPVPADAGHAGGSDE